MSKPQYDTPKQFPTPKKFEKNEIKNKIDSWVQKIEIFNWKIFKKFEPQRKNFWYKKYSASCKLSENLKKFQKIINFSKRGGGSLSCEKTQLIFANNIFWIENRRKLFGKAIGTLRESGDPHEQVWKIELLKITRSYWTSQVLTNGCAHEGSL